MAAAEESKGDRRVRMKSLSYHQAEKENSCGTHRSGVFSLRTLISLYFGLSASFFLHLLQLLAKDDTVRMTLSVLNVDELVMAGAE